MKTFLLLAFSLTTALAQAVNGAQDQDEFKEPTKHNQAPPPPRRPAVTQAPRFNQSAALRQQTPVYRAPRINPVNTNQAPRIRQFVDRDAVRSNRFNQNPEFTPHVRRNPDVVTAPQPTIPQTSINPPTNLSPRNRPNWNNLNQNNANLQNRNNTNEWRNRNHNDWQNQNNTTNWQNRTAGNFDRDDWRHNRRHHDRGWWRSHYNRFSLFGGGYYYWNNNYWYPAYGYDPYYSSYSYDEPIYSYQDQDPGQVIASVQTELQRLGYYRYAVDGLMGPATRGALARFQRDNGLSITAGIDRQTLQTLGLG